MRAVFQLQERSDVIDLNNVEIQALHVPDFPAQSDGSSPHQVVLRDHEESSGPVSSPVSSTSTSNTRRAGWTSPSMVRSQRSPSRVFLTARSATNDSRARALADLPAPPAASATKPPFPDSHSDLHVSLQRTSCQSAVGTQILTRKMSLSFLRCCARRAKHARRHLW